MTVNKNKKKTTTTSKKIDDENNKLEIKSKKKDLKTTRQNTAKAQNTELIEKPAAIKTTKVTTKKNNLSQIELADKSSNLENQKAALNFKHQEVTYKIEDTSPTVPVKPETSQLSHNQQTQQITSDKVNSLNTSKQNASNKRINQNNNRTWNNNNKFEQRELSSKAMHAIISPQLTNSDYENIFRKYAGYVAGNNDKIRTTDKEIFKGSLSMNRFKNGGMWQQFSKGREGNIFDFVQTALGCSAEEAYKTVAAEARIELQNNSNSNTNNSPKSKVQPQVQPQVQNEKNPADEWVAIEPIPDSAPKVVREVHLGFLLKHNKLDDNSIYTYKNAKNQLLGYTMRVIDKQSGEKKVLPLTYCYNKALKKESWRLKRFTDKSYIPIYGIEKTVNDDKPILIVEGEKSCRAAQKLLPEYTVISWLGGSPAADKANWKQFAGKEVIIFPDNDEPGFKAANIIRKRLNIANNYVKNVTVINPKALEFQGKIYKDILPEKWDLADALPKGISFENIKEAIITKRSRDLNLSNAKHVSADLNKFNIKDDKLQNIMGRMVWQRAVKGIRSSAQAINERAIIEHEWQKILSSEDALYYMKYAEIKGTTESTHEFLTYNNKFYQALLTSIAINSGLSSEQYLKLSEQIREVQYKYNEKAESFKNFYNTNEIYREYNRKVEQSYTTTREKPYLYKYLVRDFALLHQEQLGIEVKDLPSNYHEFMAKTICQNISMFKGVNGKGQETDKLTNLDKTYIATELCKTFSNNEVWKKLALDLVPKNQQNIIKETVVTKDTLAVTHLSENSSLKNIEHSKDINVNHDSFAEIQKKSNIIDFDHAQIRNQGIKNLRRFGTEKDINNAIDQYKNHGVDAMNDFVYKTCQSNIERKITDDLQTIENKFSGALTKEKELITVKDFKGVSYTNDDDYLKGIKQDENTMRYIPENSDLGKKIQNVVQRVIQCQTSNELER